MPIEFRCTQCEKLLRTGDDTAGKRAKCPQCGNILTVPAAGTPPAPAAGPPAPGPPEPGGQQPPIGGDPENPYQSPTRTAAAATPPSQPTGGITPTQIDMGEVFNRTWEIFKEQWGACLLAVLAVMGIAFVAYIGLVMLVMVAMAVGGEPLAVLVYVIGLLGMMVFFTWLSVGQKIYFLKIARGQPVEIGDLFTGGPYFIRVVLASLLFAVIYMVGVSLCIVPGVFFALMFSQFALLIIDRNVGVMDSFSISKDLTNGNKLTLFLIWIIVSLAAPIVVALTCGLGSFVVMPCLMLMQPVIYLMITGQPTADQLQSQQPMQ